MNSIKHLFDGVDQSDPNWLYVLASNIKTDSEAIDVILRLINSDPAAAIPADLFADHLDVEHAQALSRLIGNICVVLCAENVRKNAGDNVLDENAAESLLRRMMGGEDSDR